MVKFKYGDYPDSKFNMAQLTMGIQVELEHTNNKGIAKQIAKAHLVENPLYYTHLKNMERKFKR